MEVEDVYWGILERFIILSLCMCMCACMDWGRGGREIVLMRLLRWEAILYHFLTHPSLGHGCDGWRYSNYFVTLRKPQAMKANLELGK